jgi:transcriptional regulator GlxA family with amidase domain
MTSHTEIPTAPRGAFFFTQRGGHFTQIATNLGFYELSRFSQRYREHFGETPSATLARCTAAR